MTAIILWLATKWGLPKWLVEVIAVVAIVFLTLGSLLIFKHTYDAGKRKEGEQRLLDKWTEDARKLNEAQQAKIGPIMNSLITGVRDNAEITPLLDSAADDLLIGLCPDVPAAPDSAGVPKVPARTASQVPRPGNRDFAQAAKKDLHNLPDQVTLHNALVDYCIAVGCDKP